jgi:hypothetical protein
MQDPKTEKPVRQPELPNKNEPVQKQPANDRPIEGEGRWAQEQPDERKRQFQQGGGGGHRSVAASLGDAKA